MKIISQHRALVAFAVAGLAVTAAQAQSGSPESQWLWNPIEAVGEAVPPLPPTSVYPVQLLLDDDTSDGGFGVASGQNARQFLWFNRFSPATGFHLEEVWVLFPSGANMAVGGAVQIAIYEDPDGDPSNGANLITSFTDTIQAADDNTFSIYSVAGSPVIPTGSDLLVGVVPRFIVSGVTTPTSPAALDTTATQSRSWIAAWTTDPPDPPVLVPLPDQTLSLIDAFVPGGGNFMIRAFGIEQGVTEIPTLGEFGLVGLALALLGAGAWVLRRRREAAALALLLIAFVAPAGAVTIDTFATNQAAVSAPPPSAGTTATGAADIIGTRRGLVPAILAGVGPASASVAGGNLVLTITATTPDSRGEVLVSWDGDTTANVLSPTGLSNANLTTGDASGFQLDFASTSVITEIEITVYDDAGNFSRAARRVPVSGGAQSVRIPFAEFRVASGAGADFASVGAIEMTVRGGEGTISLNQVTTTAPTVAATKIDTQIVDNDSDTRVDPGDRVRYTVTVTNTGNEALSVDLTDTVDPNTTLVAGSLSSTPVAHNDQYGWFGNVTLVADGVAAPPLLLANDADADGDDLDVQSLVSPTAAGGTVTLDDAETGEFTYNPPTGFSGVDSFNYTAVDDNGNTSTATAFIALDGVIWFVDDSNTTPPHLGTLADPFQTLASVNGTDPDQPGDIIFLYDDDGTPYPGGHVMEADQQFLGQGAALILSGTTIVPAGGTPQMTNSGGAGITLGLNSTIRGLDVTNTSGAGIVGTSFGTFTASLVNVTGVGGSTLDLATGALATTFGTLSAVGTASQRGMQLVTVTGSLTATTTTLTNPSTQGIRVATSPAVSLSFGTTTITDNAIGSGPTATGIDLATGNGGATFTFGSLALTTDGAGLLANNSGTINVPGTGNTIAATGGAAIDVTATSVGTGWTFATLSSTNSAGKGVNLDSVTGSVTATGGAISGPAGIGFDLNGGLANVAYAGPISNTANAFLIEVTSRSSSSTTTFSGNLSSTSNGNGIRVASHLSGAPTITFSGASKILNTGADPAVTLDDNDTATIHFTGGNLDIDTTTGAGFNAINGATAITVQGTGNTITSVSATALNVSATTIGAANLTFERISAGNSNADPDPANGIVLSNTCGGVACSTNPAGVGGLIVAGNAGACEEATPTCTGGFIQNTTGGDNSGATPPGTGIVLNNTRAVSLTKMHIANNTNYAIRGLSVHGLTIDDCLIDGANGTNVSTPFQDGSLIFYGVTGSSSGITGTASIANSTIRGGHQRNIGIDNSVGTLNLTVSNNIIKRTSDAAGDDGFFLEADTDANVTLAITNNTFARHGGDHINIDFLNTADVQATITGNTLHGNYTGTPEGNHPIGLSQNIFILGAAFNGTFNYDVSSNTINGARQGGSIHVNKGSGTAVFNGRIQANVIGTTGIVGSGGSESFGIIVGARGAGGTHNTLINNNTIRQYFDRGIVLEAGEGGPGLNATVTNNSVGEFADAVNSLHGIHSDNGILGTDTSATCINISANSVATAGNEPAGGADIRLRKHPSAPISVRIPGLVGSTATDADTHITAANPLATTVTVTGAGYTGGAACTLPTFS